jgi:hypothetical protein
LASTLERGSSFGIGGTVTRPAPSAPRWLRLPRLLVRTETEPLRPVRDERERPDMVRELREVEVDREVVPLPGPCCDGMDATGSGASPHSVQ